MRGCLVAWCPTGVLGAGGLGRCVCRWAAARPRAVRAASFARRVVSKPGQAPPPPTGTAAGPSGALHTGGACGSGVPGQAPPPPTGTAAGPSGALRRPPHWRHLRCGVWLGAASRSPARPRCHPVISHAIPSDVFHGLKCDRWNSADSALVWGRAELELHAELGEFPVSLVELVAQGCTTWVGIALLSCRCNAVLSGALVLYLVHRFAVVKLVTPFRPCVSAGLKPASPLLA